MAYLLRARRGRCPMGLPEIKEERSTNKQMGLPEYKQTGQRGEIVLKINGF